MTSNNATDNSLAEGLSQEDLVIWLKAITRDSHFRKLLKTKPVSKIALNKVTKKMHFEKCFVDKAFSKDKGDWRPITAPKQEWKMAQNLILTAIEIALESSSEAVGFEPRKCIFDNAKRHRGNKYKLLIDIKDAFGMVRFEQVLHVFKSLGLQAKEADMLARFVTLKGKLPQGFPASPKILNLAMRPLDKRLAKLCEKVGLVYSRYADDITISSKTEIPQTLVNYIFGIIRSEGWKVAKRKVKLTKEDYWTTTGVLVMPDGRTTSTKRSRKNLRTLSNAHNKGAEHSTHWVYDEVLEADRLKKMPSVVQGNEAYRVLATGKFRRKKWEQTLFAKRVKCLSDELRTAKFGRELRVDELYWDKRIIQKKIPTELYEELRNQLKRNSVVSAARWQWLNDISHQDNWGGSRINEEFAPYKNTPDKDKLKGHKLKKLEWAESIIAKRDNKGQRRRKLIGDEPLPF